MGGTSTDVALCQNGQPTIGRETVDRPLPDQGAVGERAHGRRRRRLDRPRARADEGAARRPASRRAPSPGRPRTARAATQPTVTDANVVLGHLPPRLLGGEMAARRRGGAGGGADDRRRDGPRLGRAGRRGDPRDREREHGGRAAARLGAARPRPARLRARRLRRRRAAARERAREAHGLVPRDRAARAGPALRDRRPRRRLPRRVRPDVHPRCSATPSGDEVARDPRRRSASGRRRGSRARASPRRRAAITYTADMRYHRQGYEIPVALEPDEVAATAGSATSRSGSTALHEQLYGFRMPGTASEIVNLRAVGFGGVPKPELPVGEPGSARCVRRRRRRARGRSSTASGVATKIYDRVQAAARGRRFDGPAIVTEFDSTTVVLPGYARRASTRTSTS